MRILFGHKYDKYLGAFVFVLVSRNNGTIKPLYCSCALKQITETVLEQLRGATQTKAFRLNK